MTSLAAAVLIIALALAQLPAIGQQSPDGVWQIASDQSLPAALRRTDIVGSYAVLRLNRQVLEDLLARAPQEDAAPPRSELILHLPLPDGRFTRFRIEETKMLAPALAAAAPGIKTYRGAGVDDRTATASIDLGPNGLHVMVIASAATIYVDPYAPGDVVTYISFAKSSRPRPGL